MKRLHIAMCLSILALLGLAWWKNKYSYSTKTPRWRAVKSVVDTTLVVLSAMYLPALLISWIVVWLTRTVRGRGVQVTLAVIFGIVFGSISGYALEVLCVLGVISVDLVTGETGLWAWLTKPIPKTFMPKWQEVSNVND